MRLRFLVTLLAAATLTVASTAQVRVFGEPTMRRTTSQVIFGQNLTAGIAIEHGQPLWKAEYDGMFDQLKGRLLRLGSNWWTTMTSTVPVDFAGTKIPAGAYLLGLHCDTDGNFSLTFLEATKGMKQGALPFAMGDGMNWQPDYTARLKLEKNASDEVVEKMAMTLKVNPDLSGSYTLAWGPHQLTGALTIEPGRKDETGEHKGEHKRR